MSNLELRKTPSMRKEGRFAVCVALKASGSMRLEKDSDSIPLSSSPNEWPLFVVLSGKAAVTYGGRREELDASFALLVHAAAVPNSADMESAPTAYTIALAKGAADCELVFASLSGIWVDQVLCELPETAFAPFFLRKDAPLLDCICTAANEAEHNRIGDPYQNAQKAFALLTELCRRFDKDDVHDYPELVSAAIGIIKEEYQYLFGVEELASSLEVSKHHLIRQFTKHTGMSPGRFLTKTRIENAKLLLHDREYSIEIVGQLVGYANGNYFSKAFRAITGMSPGEFRSKYC